MKLFILFISICSAYTNGTGQPGILNRSESQIVSESPLMSYTASASSSSSCSTSSSFTLSILPSITPSPTAVANIIQSQLPLNSTYISSIIDSRSIATGLGISLTVFVVIVIVVSYIVKSHKKTLGLKKMIKGRTNSVKQSIVMNPSNVTSWKD